MRHILPCRMDWITLFNHTWGIVRNEKIYYISLYIIPLNAPWHNTWSDDQKLFLPMFWTSYPRGSTPLPLPIFLHSPPPPPRFFFVYLKIQILPQPIWPPPPPILHQKHPLWHKGFIGIKIGAKWILTKVNLWAHWAHELLQMGRWHHECHGLYIHHNGMEEAPQGQKKKKGGGYQGDI